MWWCIPVIPEVWRLRWEGLEFEASLSYIATNKHRKSNCRKSD
jgi:hypothetical protein